MSRLRGFLWLVAGLVVALLAALVAYMTLTRAAQTSSGQVQVEGAYENVVVMAQPVAVRTVLSADMVTTEEMPVASVPEGALTDLEQAVGKLTLAPLYAGEVVLEQRLVDPNITTGDGRLAVAMADEQVLMAVPADDLLSQVSVLKPGDQVDILISLEVPTVATAATLESPEGGEETKLVTFELLQNVTIAALPGGTLPEAQEATAEVVNQAPASPQALLVTLAPQDALTLKYALDAGGIRDITLRAPGADQKWDVEPVDIDYIIDSLKIPQ